jgi:hypothetical protein
VSGEDASTAGEAEVPSYEFRFEACKLLLELDTSIDLVVEVSHVLRFAFCRLHPVLHGAEPFLMH